jgi:hypothetical protein
MLEQTRLFWYNTRKGIAEIDKDDYFINLQNKMLLKNAIQFVHVGLLQGAKNGVG